MTNHIDIAPVAGTLRVGDVVTFDRKVDMRNWWQRRAPHWLGGRPYAPVIRQEQLSVTAVSTD